MQKMCKFIDVPNSQAADDLCPPPLFPPGSNSGSSHISSEQVPSKKVRTEQSHASC